MSNLTVMLTLLISLFVLSHASFQLTVQPENLVTESTPSNNKQSEPNLPPFKEIPISKNTETPGRIGTIRPFTGMHEIRFHPINAVMLEIRCHPTNRTVRPFTVMHEIRFHPINRYFQDNINNNNINLNDPFMYKFQHHRHRYHQQHNEKSMGPREMSYGNDMIMSQDNGVELTGDNKVEHGKYLEKEGDGFFNKARKFLGQF